VCGGGGWPGEPQLCGEAAVVSVWGGRGVNPIYIDIYVYILYIERERGRKGERCVELTLTMACRRRPVMPHSCALCARRARACVC